MKLGVNIDHVATLRNARGGIEPSVLEAGFICDKLNVAEITVHLREDRRHIKDADVYALKKQAKTPKFFRSFLLVHGLIKLVLML